MFLFYEQIPWCAADLRRSSTLLINLMYNEHPLLADGPEIAGCSLQNRFSQVSEDIHQM